MSADEQQDRTDEPMGEAERAARKAAAIEAQRVAVKPRTLRSRPNSIFEAHRDREG